MNMVRGEDDRFGGTGGADAGRGDDRGRRPLDIGTDERRMHVRAYNHWVSLLHGRAYPSIEDLDPANIADFGSNSVLLDFSRGIEDPTIQYLGRALREECGVESGITQISQVPSRSLLSRLTDHYLQIIANRAPIGFEAEFVSQRGHNTMYRGILMPFSSDEDTIDFIYGVINWKEMVDAETQARLNAEIEAARRELPRPQAAHHAWADGPSAGFDEAPATSAPEPAADTPPGADAAIWDHLDHARACAAEMAESDGRSRAALYRTLDRAYRFAEAAAADPAGYAELLADAGVKPQARAPMTPIVKLVFGIGYDKRRVTEFATVLTHARRNGVAAPEFADFLDRAEGGIKGVVAAERAARRPAADTGATLADAAKRLRERAALASLPIAAGDDEFVLLLARANIDGMLDIVATLDGDRAMTERAVRRAAR
ncbi:PAS domain-containing protein [Sphingomonas baiyangensis]|uniref:PAS domain-containing protein n=1 Tax=Sphingomonas baiyangensis TaxID=2572576 RepID=A0A4U1L8I9_9SPHN|nr:hypothetical protein [Sphingomonas baiyangensis]TKD52813.1 hypothetical protein FBR43_00155 [Sphingomonas baiyangensis]